MDVNERVIRTLDGQMPDRVPVFSAGMEDRTVNDVLGKPLITQKMFMRNPITAYILDKWGPGMTKPVVQPLLNSNYNKRIKAAVKLGFDATWALYDATFIMLDSNSMVRFSGSVYHLYDDGHSNVSYQYYKPGITSREDYIKWPYWVDPDELAHNAYKFYRTMMRKYGDKICFFGQASGYGIFESLMWAVGLQRLPLWLRREKDLVDDYIRRMEEYCIKTAVAMLDAGVKVIIQSDDFSHKTGPILNPKLIDELLGPSYRKLIETVHGQGGRLVFHSCGDNTLLFDTFIDWGVDGLHAYEPTSTVDIFGEKKRHGQQTVMIGGIDIDYILSERSRDDEVVEHVKKMIGALGAGGRYIIAPAHSMSSIPAHKLKVMIDAAHEYGKYPLAVH